MPPKVRGVRARNEPAARPWFAAVGVTGRPHARGIPWRFRPANLQPHWPRRARTGGRVKVQSRTRRVTTSPIIDGFFLGEVVSERLGRDGGPRRAERGQPSCWAFARRKAAPPRVHGLASPIRALSQTGFAIMRRGRIFGGLISHLTEGFREAMFYKGTMGTWEQAISNKQKALPLRGARLFPSRWAALGTWEQKWQIPMQENPRACGHPMPASAGERG